MSSSTLSLNAIQKGISATSSNISFSEVAGYKAEQVNYKSFQVGNNVNNSRIETYLQTNFSQGAIEQTKSNLDVAIQGKGFFITNNGTSENKFTRDGRFKLDKEGYLVTMSDSNVMGLKINKNDQFSDYSMDGLECIKIPQQSGKAVATNNINISLNLPILKNASTAKVISEFNPKDNKTFNFQTGTTVYDSVGRKNILKAYYLKPGMRKQLWDESTKALLPEPEIVDCSIVKASDQDESFQYSTEAKPQDTNELANSTAWAVFYTLNGKPIQPINEDKNDVQGFQYQAANLEYRDNNVISENVRASDGNGQIDYINISNTGIYTGKPYPGVSVNQDGLIKLKSGDRKNASRPKDFWRCQFLFMSDSGKKITVKPLESSNFQPLGAVNHIAGNEKEKPKDVDLELLRQRAEGIIREEDLSTYNEFGIAEIHPAAKQNQIISIKHTGTTMFDSAFNVEKIDSDGVPSGEVTNIDINNKGLVSVEYDNGTRKSINLIALARFNNEQGLIKNENTSWLKSESSGDAILGASGSSGFGSLKNNSIEGSNAELNVSLVGLITGQQSYQANVKSLETEKKVVDNLNELI